MRRTVARSLAESPNLAAEFHRRLNGALRPEQVRPAASRTVWWRCPRVPAHHWQARVVARTRRGSGYPFCAGRRVSADNSLAARSAKIAKQWHPTRNFPLSPSQVRIKSGRRVCWKCPRGPDHEWIASVADRHRFGCRCCAGKKSCKGDVPGNADAASGARVASGWKRAAHTARCHADVEQEGVVGAAGSRC